MPKFFFGDLVGINGSDLQGRVKTYNPKNKTYKISNARWTREYPEDILSMKKTNIQIKKEQAEREKQKQPRNAIFFWVHKGNSIIDAENELIGE